MVHAPADRAEHLSGDCGDASAGRCQLPEIQDQDIAVGPTMQEAEEAPKETPKQEQVEKVEQPPAPPQQAEVTLPQETPKEIEKPKPQVRPPAPETRAPPKTEHVGQLPKPARTLTTRWCLGTSSGSSAILRPRTARPATWWCVSCSTAWAR